MKTLLEIHTSLNGTDGLSSALVSEFVTRWRAAHSSGRVIKRDLAARALPHLTKERFQAFSTDRDQLTAAQRDALAVSDRLIEELAAADEVALGLPMYNFGIPSTLKAYFDHIARAGVTFRYTENGPEGLLSGKKALVFATRGGRYAGTDMDTQSDYVRNFLAFLGIKDVEFVYAEGTAMGDEVRAATLSRARQRIEELGALAA